MARFVDITGRRFGRLVVIRKSDKKSKNRQMFWECLCDCGNTKSINGSSLRVKFTKSCGCLNRDSTAKRNRNDSPVDASWNRLLYSYRHGAEKRKLSFEIDIDILKKITLQNCFYCGEKPKRKYSPYLKKDGTRNRSMNTKTVDELEMGIIIVNGLDRYDNKIGYIESNLVPCCPYCNRLKSNKDYDKFIERVLLIAENIKKKNVK